MECDVALKDHVAPHCGTMASEKPMISSPSPVQAPKSQYLQPPTLSFPAPMHSETDEEDPLALDEMPPMTSPRLLESPTKMVKHTHCLRRQAPRLAGKSGSDKDSPSPEKHVRTAKASMSQASTMREVLASIPGFTAKPRRRSNKKMSTAAQIEQTKDGKIDLETPDSILVGTNLRALLNTHTFSMLPPLFQQNLVQLLPSVDRPPPNVDPSLIRLSPSGLSNEFFARACLEWKDRLSEGEFTAENQMRLKTEAEKEKSKLDPWKLKHFEPIWGSKQDKLSVKTTLKLGELGADSEAFMTMNKSGPSTSGGVMGSPNKQGPGDVSMSPQASTSNSPKRIRTVGAITRAQHNLVSSSDLSDSCETSPTKKDAEEKDTPPAMLLAIAPPSMNDQTDSSFVLGSDSTHRLDLNDRIGSDEPKLFEIEVKSLCIDEKMTEVPQAVETAEEPKVDVPQSMLEQSADQMGVDSNETNMSIATKEFSSESTGGECQVTNENCSAYADTIEREIESGHEAKQGSESVSSASLSDTLRQDLAGAYPSEMCEEATTEQQVYKINNFNGLLQGVFNMQDNSLIDVPSPQIQPHMSAMPPVSAQGSDLDNFQLSHLQGGNKGIGAMITSSEETTSSASGIVDCSGENTAMDEIEPSIQNLPIGDDPIEQKFADAEHFLLESETSGDFTGLPKRTSKRSSSAEYNESKQLKFNEGLESQAAQTNDNSTTTSDGYKDEKLLMDMRYSDADTMDDKTCTSDLDVKLGLGGQLLYSNENDIEKIDAHDLLSSDYVHAERGNDNETNASTFAGVAHEGTTPENLFADIYKLQNFNGLLQNAFNMQNNFPHSSQPCMEFQAGLVASSHQMPASSSSDNVENFTVSDLTNSSATGGMGSNMLTCSEETNSSNSGIVDCSGDNSADDNSADDNAVEGHEIATRNAQEDPIDLKFEDAEQYVLESAGEISTDSGEASSIAALSGSQTIKSEDGSYMDPGGQVNLCSGEASPAATTALVGNMNMDMGMASGYGNLQHAEGIHQQQRQVSSGSASSFMSTATSISASSSSSSSSVSGQTVPVASEMLPKEGMYRHAGPDWNFPMKMEATDHGDNNFAEMNVGKEQQHLQTSNMNDLEHGNHLNDNNAMGSGGSVYRGHIYENETQDHKIKVEVPASEMEVTSTVTSNSNDSSSDQSVNGDAAAGSKSTNNFIAKQERERSASSFHQNSRSLQESPGKGEDNRLVHDYGSSYMNQRHLNHQHFQQPHFNFQPQQHSDSANIPQQYLDKTQQHNQFQNNAQMPIGHHPQRQHQNPAPATSLGKVLNKPTISNPQSAQQQRNPATYVSLSATQPLKVIPNATNNSVIPTSIAQQRPKLPLAGKGRRSSNKLPPGAVNLERSYQICQAVIQNSPNRHQLTAQLRPPPSLLVGSSSSNPPTNSNTSGSSVPKKDVANVTSTNRPVYKMMGPRLGYPKRKFVPRQPSPTSAIRHAAYSPGPPGAPGMPGLPGVPIAVQQQHPGHMQAIPGHAQPHQHGYPSQQQQQMIQGQYVLIHRANVGAADNQAPRASSAPPAQNQQIHGVNGVPISGRGRPASVDVDSNNSLPDPQIAGMPGGMRRTISNQGLPYNDATLDASNQSYLSSIGESASSSCACSLNPMVICVQCGAFCHDDCISLSKLCISCVIR